MAGIFAFKCTGCDEIHEGSPSIGFKFPGPYLDLSDERREKDAWITNDLCRITTDEHTDFFVRAILEVPIWGVSEPFLWGIWVSASEKSFDHYVATFDAPEENDGFFGWVCNDISGYPNNESLGANVHIQTDGTRPLVRLHSGNGQTHPLIHDQINGISVERAQELAEFYMH